MNLKKLIQNLVKYRRYMLYSAEASLKADVSGSYFNWLWWILDPFLFMMVYTFISLIVFGKSEPHLIPFIFVGHGAWTFFSHCVTQSVKLVRGNKSVLSRVYLPKYILLGSMIIENMIRYLITVVLTVGAAIIDHVQFSWYVLWFPVLFLGLILLIFGISTILLHIGVYMKDLNNIITVVLRLIFYMSGIFYNINKRVPKPYNKLLVYGNPIAMYMNEMRNVVLYQQAPNLKIVGFWVVISIILSIIGIGLIHKNEQTYVKAI